MNWERWFNHAISCALNIALAAYLLIAILSTPGAS